jgi:hypothetical protein
MFLNGELYPSRPPWAHALREIVKSRDVMAACWIACDLSAVTGGSHGKMSAETAFRGEHEPPVVSPSMAQRQLSLGCTSADAIDSVPGSGGLRIGVIHAW